MKPSKGTLRVRAAIDAGFGIKALADACHCSSSQIRSATAGAVPKVTVAIELLRVLGVVGARFVPRDSDELPGT